MVDIVVHRVVNRADEVVARLVRAAVSHKLMSLPRCYMHNVKSDC